MNIQAPLRREQSSRPLEGRVSLITGSSSGIGLGIARALAAAGSVVMLNGLGKPEEIGETQSTIASEFGVKVRTKIIALETADANITCNAICPGYVYTPLVEAQIDGQAKSHGIQREQVIRDVLLAQQPNKRFATVEELGALSVFLASDAAASITGTALPVDGGWTAH